MGLVPTPTELRARARDDLRMGLPVCLQADGARILAIAVETLDADRLAALRAVGKPYVAVTARRQQPQTLRGRATKQLCLTNGSAFLCSKEKNKKPTH